jgi:hypothetical protein
LLLSITSKMAEQITFPAYRKYAHGKTYFKILSESEFEEIQVIGTHFSITRITAKILPERNYIYDLLFDYQNNYEAVNEQEFKEFIGNCEKNLQKI